MRAELICQIEVGNQLGEGVLWDAQSESIWWVDIIGMKLYSYHIETKSLQEWDTPEPLCSFSLIEGRSELLAAFASGIALYEPSSGRIEWVKKLEENNPGSRLNDGRTDPYGRFWVGGVVEHEEKAIGKSALYRVEPDLSVVRVFGEISVSNSLCWSPLGDYLYHTDTPTRAIKRYPMSASGALGLGEVFAISDEGCYPDGAIVDSDGFLYSAQWDGFKVVCYSRSGELDSELALAISRPTCVVFGGRDLDLMIVTSAAVGVDEAGAGDVFIFQVDRVGMASPRVILA
jgi:sugar lactone lactonase YvrE